MKIAITGGSGLIGTALTKRLQERGDEVISITRQMLSLSPQELSSQLDGIQILINLAGAPILSRWTSARKKEIYDSRIVTTRKLVDAIVLMQEPPELLISGSAIGIYSSQGEHTEESVQFSDDFLGNVCRDWEAAAMKSPVRTVILRTGIVLSTEGGALKKMLLPFRLGLGGRIASGRQVLSWMHMEDYIEAILFIIDTAAPPDVVNMASPHPLDNTSFVRILGEALKRPVIFQVPGFVLKLIFGEGAVTLTKGHSVIPKRLTEAGFRYRYPDLKSALSNLLS